MTKTVWLIIVLMLTSIGSFLIYRGCTFSFTERDMNGDGVIDWRDFDVNSDGTVNILDSSQVVLHKSMIGDANYDSKYDFNGDGFIDDTDVQIVFNHFLGGGLSLINVYFYRATTIQGIQIIAGAILIVVAVVLAIVKIGKKGR